jgi:hypothetical protein
MLPTLLNPIGTGPEIPLMVIGSVALPVPQLFAISRLTVPVPVPKGQVTVTVGVPFPVIVGVPVVAVAVQMNVTPVVIEEV